MGCWSAGGIAQIKDLECVFQSIIAVVIGFAGLASFIVLIMGGLKLITSGGNPDQAGAAKKQITFAIAGLIFIAMSYIIIRLIEDFTGAPITQFRVVQ